MTETVTFSIRWDGVEVQQTFAGAAHARRVWKAEAGKAPNGVRVTLHELQGGGMEELVGWSRKPLDAEWGGAAQGHPQMAGETLSLVKMAQELCNAGLNPCEATGRLLQLAASGDCMGFLASADQAQAIAELERRFSGHTTKPWEVKPWA